MCVCVCEEDILIQNQGMFSIVKEKLFWIWCLRKYEIFIKSTSFVLENLHLYMPLVLFLLQSYNFPRENNLIMIDDNTTDITISLLIITNRV